MPQNHSETHNTEKLTRRTLLKITHASALVLTFAVPSKVSSAAHDRAALNVFLKIDTDDTVAIITPGAELGQGIFTSLPKILCDELDADFSKVEIRLPYGDDKAFTNPAIGGRQTIGGSTSTVGYYAIMRKAGAAARQMLVTAASVKWGTSSSECTVDNGFIHHNATGRRLSFGQVAAAASKLPIPTNPMLKNVADFKLIGTSVPRKDTPSKIDGAAQYGADIVLPGLLMAAIKFPPTLGATASSFDVQSIAHFSGVIKVIELRNDAEQTNAIAVVATSFWQAKRAAEVLAVEWDSHNIGTISSSQIRDEMRSALADDSLTRSRKEGRAGDIEAGLHDATRTIDVIYEAPYLAHACMEPMAITALVEEDRCTVWAPTQQPAAVRELAKKLTGLAHEKVTVETVFAGGGFGRKWEMDFPTQVLQIAIAMRGVPIRLVWTREQDIRNDFYRPAAIARTRAGIDRSGNITAIHSRAVVQSITEYKHLSPDPAAVDGSAVEGLIGSSYKLPSFVSEYVPAKPRIPIGFWRSVGLSQNAFFAESAIDELAYLGHKDPYVLRRELLHDKPRELKVIDTVAQMAGWGRKLEPGHGLGMAFTVGFRSFIAQIAEVSVKAGAISVRKIWCALDAGLIVDPAAVLAQIESGITFGLSAALFGEITVQESAIVQGNFSDYPLAKMEHMPDIEAQLIQGAEIPSGVGEAPVPGVAPAIANAIFAATGQRLRRLPLRIVASA